MATVLVIDDDAAVLEVLRRFLHGDIMTVVTASTAAEGLRQLSHTDPDLVVLDVMLPDGSGLDTLRQIQQQNAMLPILVISASTASENAIDAIQLGAIDYLLKPLDLPQLRTIVEKALAIREQLRIPGAASESGQADVDVSLLIGRCPAMQHVYKAVGRVAGQNATVLIHGESGTGKELIARAIYHHSPRREAKFLAVNCAAIPESLLESELFGHERGAFTGADTRRIGKFEQCSGGTLFLDEIGDMSPLSQSKVLRVLQEQRFERVGGHETIHTDVRIIAATNRDLEKMVIAGHFRADLFYRLNGFTIDLPPLRNRGEDILLLVQHYLGQLSRELHKHVKSVSSEVATIFTDYAWPGNIRQLHSVLKQAILQANGPVLTPDCLPTELRHANEPEQAVAATRSSLETFILREMQAGCNTLYGDTIAHVERELFTHVLQETAGNQSQAAKILGITRGTLRNKIHQLHITIAPIVKVDDAETNHEPHLHHNSRERNGNVRLPR